MQEHNQTDSAEALWEFATTVYAQPGVAEACLELQDHHDLDVNLLLHAAWLATRGVALGVAEAMALDKRCTPWREAVIQPLRRQRREWRDRARLADEYRAIKALELAAEREQLARLADFMPREAGALPAVELLAYNLQAAAATRESSSDGAIQRLADALRAGQDAYSGARKPPD